MASVDSDRREGEEEAQMELISFICKSRKGRWQFFEVQNEGYLFGNLRLERL